MRTAQSTNAKLQASGPAYDLKLGTGNGKTGPAFSLTAGASCPAQTSGCNGCYAQIGRMALHQAKDKRYGINYAQCIAALKAGGARELALALVKAIDAAKTTTVRVHDSGDFFSPSYVEAWEMAARLRPDVTFWAYTRSWQIPTLANALNHLAALPNFSLWRSTDTDMWIGALAAHKSTPWAGVVFMQREGQGEADIAVILNKSLPAGQYVNFPAHASFGKVSSEIAQVAVRNCPAITGAIPHDKNNPACLKCRLCLPS